MQERAHPDPIDPPVRVAVVGSGVAGLGAAYVLSRAHEVELFERESRIGGHVHTVEHDRLALDIGFIVHNVPNYPLLNRLFRELEVATQDSEMSFSVSCARCGLEWSGRRPYAQPRNLASLRFNRFLLEVDTLAQDGPRVAGGDRRDGHARRVRRPPGLLGALPSGISSFR